MGEQTKVAPSTENSTDGGRFTEFQRLKEEGSDSLGNSFLRKHRGLKEEESISFDDDSNKAKDAGAVSGGGGKLNVLFSDSDNSFADVPLTDDEVNSNVIQEETKGEEGNSAKVPITKES